MCIKIIGIGSPFGDDRLGWEVVEYLKQSDYLTSRLKQYISLEYYDRPGLNLLSLIKKVDRVILIDAVKSNSSPGAFHYLENEEIETSSLLMSTHGFGIGHTLELGRVLGNMPEQIVFYGLEINLHNTSEDLSQEILKNFTFLIDKIKAKLHAWINKS